ncbi:uncharacterized protein MELLADRAFT_104767 [Melampsora larici-populina 98AG31]|uniref:Uncharacterized protein n=1 Tax=Melampsora larici-populina (strain 98AG31 / pathotype 3-4-7) TaxID=747676 RepID=F4RFU5_MELLP|nr:uncharacterized protein MELLADRAFT_104767 [Melampsora larici-populina 98AG31]EGG08413.1 hypothetical protein MELLADRAFT_104767 [Melampsora larici-populina 98AG31]
MSFQLQLEQTNRVLTRAEAAATGVQPGNRLITPKRGGNGCADRRSVQSHKTPTGGRTGQASGIQKHGQTIQTGSKEEGPQELQAVEEEMDEWGGIGSGSEEQREQEDEQEGHEEDTSQNGKLKTSPSLTSKRVPDLFSPFRLLPIRKSPKFLYCIQFNIL